MELRHVILHELAHIKRGDLPVALLAAGLQALHWFNPFIWYAFHRMRQDREFACDALALAHLDPGDATAYGNTLLQLVGKRNRPRLAAAAILEHRSNLKRRLDMIIRHSASGYRLSWLGVTAAVLAALPLFTQASAGSGPAPAAPGAYPYVIPIETYETGWSGFRDGDNIAITELRGTTPVIEAGGAYRVTGQYTLASEGAAHMALFNTNGEVELIGDRKDEAVDKGSGEFTREFRIVRPGMLHVSYYPINGGEGFGGCYFRQQPVPQDDPNAMIDLAVDGLKVELSDRWKGYTLNTRIQNNGNAVAPRFKIWFYVGDPNTSKPITHQGGPIYPGETWSESTMPVDLVAGKNEFYVVIDPDDRVVESDESNNVATVSAQGRKVIKEVIELDAVN